MSKIELKFRLGKHSVAFDSVTAGKMIIESLEKVGIKSGKFTLYLGRSVRGSEFKQGYHPTGFKTQTLRGSIQTGDNGSCFKCNLQIPKDMDAETILNLLREPEPKLEKPVEAETKERSEELNTPIISVEKKKVFEVLAFINDPDSRALTLGCIHDLLIKNKSESITSKELRDEMIVRGYIQDEFTIQSINRMCVLLREKNLISKADLDSKPVRYILTNEAIKIISAEISTPDAVEILKPKKATSTRREERHRLVEILDQCDQEIERIVTEISLKEEKLRKLKVELEGTETEREKAAEALRKSIKI